MLRQTFPLGRIAGIPVGAHWSTLLIGGLLTVSVATGLLPAVDPDLPATLAWVLGLLTATAFLASLLAHELGHAIVARRAGVPVESITLWLFGGVAALGAEPDDPRDELRIAAAGPAVSVAAAVGFGLGAAALGAVTAPVALVGVAAWLAAINGVLAVFNLLPGLPLDGGRILRAWLWWRRGDQLSATVTAARGGQVVGGGLMGLGLLQFVSVGGGLWTAAIGFVLFQAAKAELANRRSRSLLEGARVADALDPHPVVVPAWADVTWLRTHLPHLGGRGEVLLHDPEGRIVGLVTLDQLATSPAPAPATLADLGHGAAGDDGVAVTTPGRLLLDALADTRGRPEGYLVVFDGGRLVGLVTPATTERLLEWRRLGAGWEAAPASGERVTR